MTEPELKNRVGIFLIIGHFGVVLTVISISLLGGFSQEEMTTTLAIIGPFFAAYTTAIIRHIIHNRHVSTRKRKARQLTGTFVAISFALPTLFVSLLALVVVLKGFNIGINSFEYFKVLLGVLETSFGIYVGQIIFSLFERVEEE